MTRLSYAEERAAVAAAVARFPQTFSLRHAPGDTFRVSAQDSYHADFGGPYPYGPLLYTERLVDGRWLSYAKGTEEELRAQVLAVPAREPRSTTREPSTLCRILDDAAALGDAAWLQFLALRWERHAGKATTSVQRELWENAANAAWYRAMAIRRRLQGLVERAVANETQAERHIHAVTAIATEARHV